MLNRLFDAHLGGGGGGGDTELPQFAKDIASIIFRGPAEYFEGQNGGHGLGSGIFGDMLAGYNAGSAQDLFGGLAGDTLGHVRNTGQGFGDQAAWLSQRGIDAAMPLNHMAREGANHSRDYNNLNGAFLQQASNGWDSLMGLVNGGGASGMSNLSRTPGIGPSGQAALAAAKDTGPDSALYGRTWDMLKPQVRSAWSSRGMGTSGSAIAGEQAQAQQLADQFAQRANAEKNAFLQTGAASEGANASLQGSYNSALANMFGSQMQGATAATEAPSRIFSTMQGGLGQGIQNIGAALGQYLQPMQMNQAGLSGFNSGYQTPVNYQQMLYNYFRSPQSQAMGLPSSTGQEQNKPPRNGLLGQLFGFDKGS
jgi:hypothetical protein